MFQKLTWKFEIDKKERVQNCNYTSSTNLTRPPMLYLSIEFETSKKLLALYKVKDQKALAGMGSVKLTV